MPRFFYNLPTRLFKKGTYGLFFAIPFFAGLAEAKFPNSQFFLQKGSFGLNKYDSLENQIYLKAEKNNPGKLNNQPSQDNFDKIVVDKSSEPKVLVSEVIIEGLGDHPDKERLEFAAYDAMKARPGSTVSRGDLKLDLDSIYATGWFSGVRIEPINGPLGVQLVVDLQPNPVLTKVEIDPANIKLNRKIIRKKFQFDYGKTLNLNTLQLRLKELKNWYVDQGYSLARISGPSRVTSDGVVQLKVIEGTVSGVEITFLNKEGETTDDKGRTINGKTKPWVIKREISIKKGDLFNRNKLEKDIKRLYSTSLFSDIKVTLKPVSEEPGVVVIMLSITEQSTGSLTGGIGYSQSQGIFGQVGLQDSNLFGRAWNSTLNLTYGQYGGLANITFSDPWIKGDKFRTSFRTSLFLSREVPQVFRSQESGTIRAVSDYYDAGSNKAYDISSDDHLEGKFDSVAEAKTASPSNSWFDYDGNSVALQRTGANFIFSRPLNGGDPYKKVPWSVLAGMSIQNVRPINYAGESNPYGVATRTLENGTVDNEDVICIAFNCAEENDLFGIRGAVTYNKLNDNRNPTSGNFISFGTEQFISIGENSPTFNRARITYTHFIPVNWLKIAKECRPQEGQKSNCPQAIGLQLKAGTIVGELPPYEAFCLGGASSVRGWSACDLAVGRSFGEASAEYRFPIWRLVSGSLFVDAGTAIGSQENVPGKPGKLLEKPGSGFSLGSGVIVNTPVGPLRLEAASQGLDGEWRFNLGVGWKF